MFSSLQRWNRYSEYINSSIVYVPSGKFEFNIENWNPENGFQVNCAAINLILARFIKAYDIYIFCQMLINLFVSGRASVSMHVSLSLRFIGNKYGKFMEKLTYFFNNFWDHVRYVYGRTFTWQALPYNRIAKYFHCTTILKGLSLCSSQGQMQFITLCLSTF